MNAALHFKQFGKYEIIRKIGRSMTDVYLALDPEANRRVVLKIVEHSHDSYTQLVMEAEKRGAAIQEQLHGLDPRILEIYDYGEQNGCFFVAMEYVEGRSLAEVLRAEQRLDARRAARIAVEVCSQLQTLHSFEADIDGRKRAVVHGDIKPANIQIGSHDEVRLLDFGIAKSITSTHNLTHHNLGSPAYCSPERVKNSQVDQNADLWALGVSLYEMVGGMPPYQAQNTRKLENLIQSRRPPRALPESCPPALKAVISKALAGDIEHRYTSTEAFGHDLQMFLQNRATVAETERVRAWDSNATLDKDPLRKTALKALRLKAASAFTEFNKILWAGIAGLAFGLLLFVPAGNTYRLFSQSAPLRGQHDYARRNVSEIASDWSLYQSLKEKGSWLGKYSPVTSARQSLHANLLAAANEIIERYRTSADPAIDKLDWAKARFCLERALEMEPHDRESRARLALVAGYEQLVKDSKSDQSAEVARASFAGAVLDDPRFADPHLGLARVSVYMFHNVGMAMAEFQAAERLGFRLGPREYEQQADAYLYRAEQAFQQWRNAARAARSIQAHYWTPAQRDFDRARQLYEPITGFSNVSHNLDQIERDEGQQRDIQAARDRVAQQARMRAARYRHVRYYRR